MKKNKKSGWTMKIRFWNGLLRWVACRTLRAQGWTQDADGRWRLILTPKTGLTTWFADAVRRVLES